MRGSYVDPDAGKITLDAYFADFSERQLWETGTRSAMSLAVRCTDLGATPLAQLRRSQIETWVKRMSADGLAPGTIKTQVNNVRSVLHAAVRDQMIAVDPSDNIVLPRDRRREAAMVLPTADQVAAVIAAATPWFEAFVALAAFAGLRLGEAAGTQVGDINFLARSLDVRRQVQRGGAGAIEVRAPKYGSERTVFLADGLSTCSPNTLPRTGPVRTLDDGCSRRVRASHPTRTPPDINGAEHAAERTSGA
jgi:integrase